MITMLNNFPLYFLRHPTLVLVRREGNPIPAKRHDEFYFLVPSYVLRFCVNLLPLILFILYVHLQLPLAYVFLGTARIAITTMPIIIPTKIVTLLTLFKFGPFPRLQAYVGTRPYLIEPVNEPASTMYANLFTSLPLSDARFAKVIYVGPNIIPSNCVSLIDPTTTTGTCVC